MEVVKDKVAELAATMESLQMSVSVMERNQRHLHETINEVQQHTHTHTHTHTPSNLGQTHTQSFMLAKLILVEW